MIALAFLLLVGGLLWPGITGAVLQRFWNDLIERPDAPMKLRFIPDETLVVALLLAFVPCLLIRGPIARIAGRSHGGGFSHCLS